MSKTSKDAQRLASIAAVAMPEARAVQAWHEGLIMQREASAAVLAKYRATMAQQVQAMVAKGAPEHIARERVANAADAAFVAKLSQQAAAARQSRRDYEADKRDVVLRKPTNASDRGANGRARARCIDRNTGRETSPRPFAGRAHWAVVQARANADATYATSYDDNGVWLGTTAVLHDDNGAPTGYGALCELANLAPSRPANPAAAAIAHITCEEHAVQRAAELNQAAAAARRAARRDGRKPKRGKRGGKRGKA